MKSKTRIAAPALFVALGIMAGCGDQEATQADRSMGQRAEAPRAGTDTAPVPGTSATGPAAGTSAPGVQVDQATIRQAEQQLQAAGLNPGKVDGVVDKNTREAVRKFQEQNKLEATGELNQDTLLALKAEGGSAPSRGTKAP
jgi:peptidoglycan hydrolase-like protein with peptidoglycan-binding domain